MSDYEETQVDAIELPTHVKSNGTPPDLLWINEGTDFVVSTVYVYQDTVTGRLRTILLEPSLNLREMGMPEFPVETRWSVPTKMQLGKYRERSSRYNQSARAVLIQRGILEDLIIQNHLLEMKLGQDGSQTEVELIRDKKGALTAEALSHLNKLHPSVMEMIFAKFVDEAALII